MAEQNQTSKPQHDLAGRQADIDSLRLREVPVTEPQKMVNTQGKTAPAPQPSYPSGTDNTRGL